jgi:hypothetical protein
MEEAPVDPTGSSGTSSSQTGGSTSSQGSQNTPQMPVSDTSDPWYKYAQQMFPNTEITPEIIAGLKKNMMSMIGTTISEINARHATANQYNKDVAQGNE